MHTNEKGYESQKACDTHSALEKLMRRLKVMIMKDRGIIIGACVNNQVSFEEEIIELRNLCEACNIEIVDQMVQNVTGIHPKTYLGSGKVNELSDLIAETNATVAVFLHELTPSQIKHLDEELQIEILDRTALILEIFASRAKTREAKLQVEVVRLQYELPRLIGRNANLSRQAGGSGAAGGGTGAGGRNKGAGETKLELNRRQIDARIVQLQKELDQLAVQRTTQRNRRKKNGLPMVALVGYTNAGKSTVMNYMIKKYIREEQKEVFEKNMLFATLETSIRKIELPNKDEFLLSDTVGFVSNLPHELVKAFRSTLEEACEADLLLHVVDRNNPDYKTQIEVTKKTLQEIGADQIPVLYVYNKIDQLSETDLELEQPSENQVYISAKQGEGMDELINKIVKKVMPEKVKMHVMIPYKNGDIISKVKAFTQVLSEDCKQDGIEYELECTKSNLAWIQPYVI